MISVILKEKGETAHREFTSLFKFENLQIPADSLAEYVATMILARIRRRYMKAENPDGSPWPMTRAASKRLGGGKVYAAGGKYAPGGMRTGGGILFASGNLFHSISLETIGSGSYSIATDVPYAAKWMNDQYTIIGTTTEEVNLFVEAALTRLL